MIRTSLNPPSSPDLGPVIGSQVPLGILFCGHCGALPSYFLLALVILL